LKKDPKVIHFISFTVSTFEIIFFVIKEMHILQKRMFIAGYKPACRNKPNSTLIFTFCGAKERSFAKFTKMLPWMPNEKTDSLVNKDLCLYITYKYTNRSFSDLAFQERDCATTFAGFALEAI